MTAMWLARVGLEASRSSVGRENESVPKNKIENGGGVLLVLEAKARD